MIFLGYRESVANCMAHPQISIVIPAYNESARIENALERVLCCVAQKGWDAEVLVVDDGSTDDTAAIVHRWMTQHPRLNLVQNPGNRGKGYSSIASSSDAASTGSPAPSSVSPSRTPSADSKPSNAPPPRSSSASRPLSAGASIRRFSSSPASFATSSARFPSLGDTTSAAACPISGTV
jgi:hypothetical protein